MNTQEQEVFVRRYRVIRYLFWLSLGGSIAGVFWATPIALLFALIAFVLAIASLFQPCPNCQKSVGFKRYGPFLAGVPVVRHCIHCGANLCKISTASNPSFKGDALKRAPYLKR